MELDKLRRAQFLVEVISARKEVGGSLKTILSLGGYRLFWAESESQVITEDNGNPPHITLVDLSAIKDIGQFIEKRLRWNPENLFIVLAPISLSVKLEELRPYGVYAVLPLEEGFDSAGLMLVDLLASELFLRYQNEQLFERCSQNEKDTQGEISHLRKQLTEKDTQIRKLTEDALAREREFEKKKLDLEQELLQLRKNQGSLVWLTQIKSRSLVPEKGEQEPVVYFFDLLEQDLDFLQGRLWYFKFIPEVQSFTVVHFKSWPHQEELKPTDPYRPVESSPAEFIDQLNKGTMSDEFAHYLTKSFGDGPYQGVALSFPHGIEGVVVRAFEGPGIDLADKKFLLLWNLFQWQLGYQKLWKKYETTIKFIDPVTQLEGRDSYFRKLHEEVSRADRLKLPVSLIKVAVDSLEEIGVAYGKRVTDSLLLQIAHIIRSTSRIHDLHYRSGENEFSLILPHTFVQGAVIRAERLRRLIETHEFMDYPARHLSISCGVSGLPELVENLEDLDKSATEALNFIRRKTYNKVCLYKNQASVEGGS